MTGGDPVPFAYDRPLAHDYRTEVVQTGARADDGQVRNQVDTLRGSKAPDFSEACASFVIRGGVLFVVTYGTTHVQNASRSG